MKQMTRALVDNMVNGIQDEIRNVRANEGDYALYNEAVLMAIQSHGLQQNTETEERGNNDNEIDDERNDKNNDELVEEEEEKCKENNDKPNKTSNQLEEIELNSNNSQVTDNSEPSEPNGNSSSDNTDTDLLPIDSDDFLAQAVSAAINNKGLSA